MLFQSLPASLRSHSVVVSAAANGAMRASAAACERCSRMVCELCVGSGRGCCGGRVLSLHCAELRAAILIQVWCRTAAQIRSPALMGRESTQQQSGFAC